MFRLLTAGEIECRVAQVGKSNDRVWCSILIYKDARVDQKLLDEVVGPMNWKCSYEFINGSLYCTVSLYDKEKKEWISKQNVGVESNTEKEKGQASDAFKRACFNWGLGRELYSAPKDVFINLEKGEYAEKDGRYQCRVRFDVKEIAYDDNRQISKLVIVDNSGKVRYSFPKKAESKPTEKKPAKPNVFLGKKGEKLVEGGEAWNKAAKRIANGDTAKDGTPLAVMMAEYYSIPKDAMARFLRLVESLTKAA